MNVVWFSNAPWNASGYGQQTMQVVRRLIADGHQVAIAANHGSRSVIEADPALPGVAVLPMHRKATGEDILPGHWRAYTDHFGPTLVLTLWDVWPLEVGTDALCPSCGHVFPVSVKPLDGLPIASWVPVEHDPVPPRVANWCRVHRPIAMSRFGQRSLGSIGIEADYVPHALEPGVFVPGDRDEARRELGWDPAGFYVLVNAANKGWPARKSWPELLDAMGRFMSRHPLARLYLHTDRTGPDSPDLGALIAAMGVPAERVLWSPNYQTAVGLYGPERLARVYQASDVLLLPSKGEGFGIPVIEAQACGTPVIVSDFSAQPELVGGGWLVAGQREWDATQDAFWFMPFVDSIVACLEAAHDARGDTALRERAIAKAAEYDADRVYAEHWRPLLPRLEADLLRTSMEVAA